MINFANWESGGAGYWLAGKLPSFIEKICNDTRKLTPDACFIAIRTERADGHDFVVQAEQRGASCAIVDREVPGVTIPQFICEDTIRGLDKIASIARKSFWGKIIGITGSIGKTSTKDILSLLLGVQNNKTFLTENGHLGVPFTLAKLTNDEPFAVVEVGIDDIGTIGKFIEIVEPDECIVTGVARIHLNNFGDVDTIASEKVKFAEYALSKSRRCILAKELLRFECFEKIAKFCTVPSDNPEAEVYFSVEHLVDDRRLHLRVGGQNCDLDIPLQMSEGTVRNLVLAVTCALLNGVAPATIGERLQNWQPSHIRGAISTVNGRTFFVDCYNANPAAFLDSLENFDRLFPSGNRVFVIGSFSDRELGKFSAEESVELGRNIPVRSGDIVVLVGKHAEDVRAGLLEMFPKFANVHCIEKTEDAQNFVREHRGAVYLKGHGIYHLETLIG